jgi:hypothetical protein
VCFVASLLNIKCVCHKHLLFNAILFVCVLLDEARGVGVNTNFRCSLELIYSSLCKLNSHSSKIIIKQPTRKTPRFLYGKPSNMKVKITRPSLVKYFTINNNEFKIVFPREISRSYHHIKNTCIIGLNINSSS